MGLEIDRRLELIIEAIAYARRVRDLGMPVSCYAKALREPIFFLWECYQINKIQAAQYVSLAARGKIYGKGEIVYDHCVPYNIVQDKLLALQEPRTSAVREILERFVVAAIITKYEDQQLNKHKLKSKMPRAWDGMNILARYETVGIQLGPNPSYSG